MSLQPAIQGDLYTGQTITWLAGTIPKPITGATITGKIINSAGVATAIAGTLTVTDGANGIFTWVYAAGDTANVGAFKVQFTATFAGSPDSSYEMDWTVYKKY